MGSSKCKYSHENASSIRICVKYFSIGCSFNKTCRFRHFKTEQDNLPSKQQSLHDRFKNRFGLLNGNQYFVNFIQIPPKGQNYV